MRNELENIERVERFLNNEMSQTERSAFEQELSTDAELQGLTENMDALRKAVFRHELRTKIERNSKGGNGFGKSAIVGMIMVGIGALLWLFWPASTPLKQSPVEATTVLVGHEEVFDTAEETVDTTLVEVVPVVKSLPSKKQESQPTTENEERVAEHAFTLGGHTLWTEPDIQTFQFRSGEGATIEGKDGMLVIVPSDAFVDENGKPLSGKVEFKLVEALSIQEMVLYKLKTVSNGAPLESGGMFYTEATVDGKVANINPKRPLYIEIPTTEKKMGMMAFKGVVDKAGNINWVDPNPLKKYLVRLPLADLDFLPPGFEAEVKGNMPFLNYKTASAEVIDSLYYSLKNVEKEDKRTLPKRWSPGGETRDYAKSEIACGIRPTTVEAIKTEEYSQTFIATKEFEARIALLHKLEDGNPLVEIYLNHLTKDLYISDSLVAEMVDDGYEETFKLWAREKLTNVKDAPLYQKRLSEYYVKKTGELSKARRQLAAELAEKNKRELDALYEQATGTSGRLEANASLFRSLPNPSVATGNVYSIPWANMGWGNIDRYYKLLDGGTTETQITVQNRPKNTSVTQWLGAINTYTDLIPTANGFRAVFPKNQKTSSKTHVFAIAKIDSTYMWGLKHYDPYQDPSIRFEMATASIADIKNDLRRVNANFGMLKRHLAWKEEQAKQAIIWATQARQKREAWMKQREELFASYKDEFRRQREIELTLKKLRKAAFPCSETNISSMVVEEPLQTEPDTYVIVEDMPTYPGGDAALLQFISENTVYPEEAKSKGISGTPYVSYVVDQTGSVINPQVVRSSGNQALDQEALRVISLIKGFTPGRQRGQPVAVQFTMPVRFWLN
ncbi:MAG: TonB family protein [Flavobacteriales bacterium]|nr:TonB family protein [Flavobacteriales bacterium]